MNERTLIWLVIAVVIAGLLIRVFVKIVRASLKLAVVLFVLAVVAFTVGGTWLAGLMR